MLYRRKQDRAPANEFVLINKVTIDEQEAMTFCSLFFGINLQECFINQLELSITLLHSTVITHCGYTLKQGIPHRQNQFVIIITKKKL